MSIESDRRVLPGAEALAHAAMLSTSAVGYELTEIDASGSTIRRCSRGVAICVAPRAKDTPSVTIQDRGVAAFFPLRSEGALIGIAGFLFAQASLHPEKFIALDRAARAIENFLSIPYRTRSAAQQLGEFETELASIKIAERIRGLLAAGQLETETLDLILRHVDHVLDGRGLQGMLDEALVNLAERLEERKVLARAKETLERLGYTEEGAYMLLRNRSRVTRKRLRAVAQEVIEGRTDFESRVPVSESNAVNLEERSA